MCVCVCLQKCRGTDKGDAWAVCILCVCVCVYPALSVSLEKAAEGERQRSMWLQCVSLSPLWCRGGGQGVDERVRQNQKWWKMQQYRWNYESEKTLAESIWSFTF